jgi:hypothetical protein
VPILRCGCPAAGALLVGLAVFGLLWLSNIPFRRAYQPTDNDVTAFADGLLLLPGGHWQDWFTRGYSDFFESYPEWPHQHLTSFARPAFQFLIYLAHLVFDGDWASYLAINYLGVAGIAAVAFVIARGTLGLGNLSSLVAAGLVALSAAVLEFSIWELGFASESLSSMLVGCGFLAVVARRHVLCLVLLSIALLTKETAVWAPIAAALTVLLRASHDDGPRRRTVVAAAMLAPLALWLGLRIAFFGGIGGTYATADYAPFIEFLTLTSRKLEYIYQLFVTQHAFAEIGLWSFMDRVIRIGTGLIILLLLLQWGLSGLRRTIGCLLQSTREKRWPSIDPGLLVTLWAVLALAFYFAIALRDARYAASAMLFTWPVVVAEAVRRSSVLPRLGLAICIVLSFARVSHLVAGRNPPPEQSPEGRFFRAVAAMNAALREVPPDIGQVYVLSASGLSWENPEYLRAFLGMRAEIVRIVEIEGPTGRIAFDHDIVDGVVTLNATASDHARFFLSLAGIDSGAFANGQLRRSDTIVYDLPAIDSVEASGRWRPTFEPPQRMTVHVRPRARARFIIEHGGSDGGLAWFDTP